MSRHCSRSAPLHDSTKEHFLESRKLRLAFLPLSFELVGVGEFPDRGVAHTRARRTLPLPDPCALRSVSRLSAVWRPLLES